MIGRKEKETGSDKLDKQETKIKGMINTLSSPEDIQRGNQSPAKDHKVAIFLWRKDGGIEKQDERPQRLGQKYSVLEKFEC